MPIFGRFFWRKNVKSNCGDINAAASFFAVRRALFSLLTVFLYFQAFFNVAHADSHGCRVLLCLSDPRGPTTEPACWPDIEKLWHDLSKGRPFPRCEFAKSPYGNSYAKPGYNHFDDCNPGTIALEYRNYGLKKGTTQLYMGIGEGKNLFWTSNNKALPKVCVANPVGRGSYQSGYDSITYTIYDTLITQQPASSPRYIDVFVNEHLYQRVRW